MNGCTGAFHLAAYAKVWSKDPDLPHLVNVTGTRNIFDAAKQLNLQKVVFTSTGGTLNPSNGNIPVDEETPRTVDFFNAYESTKAKAEKLAQQYAGQGLHVVTVNPTRVYGPGTENQSAAMTMIIRKFHKGVWRIIPGSGKKCGNYVFIDDVVEGHLLAMEKGRAGQRYIIGGENATYDQFFETLKKVTGQNRIMVHIPYGLLNFVVWMQFVATRSVGKMPLITPRWIRKYLHHWACSNRKSKVELGYRITPLEKGIKKTIEWIESKKMSRK
jgi:nucleoside-diphosphate-sugar epimerase